VDTLAVTTDGGTQAAPAEEPWPVEGADPVPQAPFDYPGMGANPYMGRRVQLPRDEYDEPPAGKPSPLGQKARKRKDGAWEYAFPVGKLPAGGYLITAEVWDETDWVVKDEKHLLRERVSWRVKVAPPAKPEAAAPPQKR
jgi:hypothetical protein